MLSYIYTGNISSRAETRPSDSIPPHWSVAKFQIMRMLSCWYGVWLGKLSVWGVGYICALWYREGGSSDFFSLYFLHPLCSTGAAHDNTYVVGGTQSSSPSSSAWWWWWWWWWYPVLTSQQHHGYRVKLLSVCVRSYISEAHRYQASEAKVQSRTISWLKQATSEIFICQIVKETHRPIHRHIIYRHIYTLHHDKDILHTVHSVSTGKQTQVHFVFRQTHFILYTVLQHILDTSNTALGHTDIFSTVLQHTDISNTILKNTDTMYSVLEYTHTDSLYLQDTHRHILHKS